MNLQPITYLTEVLSLFVETLEFLINILFQIYPCFKQSQNYISPYGCFNEPQSKSRKCSKRN